MKGQKEDANPGWVYLLQTGWHYKIGKAKDVKQRVAALQTSSPYKIDLLFAVRTEHMSTNEATCHGVYAEFRTNGEWFEFAYDMVEEVKSFMLEIEEDDFLIGDIGDDRNYVFYMDGDYTIHKKLKTSIPLIGEDIWFPDLEMFEAWNIWFGVAPCPCLCHDRDDLPIEHVCDRCKGAYWLMGLSDDVSSGRAPVTGKNSRLLTAEESRLVRKYLDWCDQQEEESERAA